MWRYQVFDAKGNFISREDRPSRPATFITKADADNEAAYWTKRLKRRHVVRRVSSRYLSAL